MVAKDDDGPNRKFNKKVDAMEMEMLNPNGNGASSSVKSPKASSSVSETLGRVWNLVRLYYELYPRAFRIIQILAFILIFKLLFLRHRGKERYLPPRLEHHYGDLQSYYDLQTAKIDHWCLRGGNDGCTCDDPTTELGRFQYPGWNKVFERNKRVAEEAAETQDLDVVFLGDEFTQSWTGMQMTKPRIGGTTIASLFNQTFQKEKGGNIDGLPLGIYGDTTANLLYRINHGEIPDELNPKVWWILIGANDLVRGQCSEEAVVLGILRLADEFTVKKPGSIIVIQGLLPRSSFKDGSLQNIQKPPSSSFHHSSSHVKSKQYYKPEEYPLWPSIRAINEELEKFCAQHDHLVYFDTSKLFFGSLGNDHFQSSQKTILKELMPDYAHPSAKGYQILARVIGEELEEIIYESDEDNQVVGGNQ